MEPISIEELALLEVLFRIDAGELKPSDSLVMPRMFREGLVASTQHGLVLTPAGIELCKSLQHRKAADAYAARVREQRARAFIPEVAPEDSKTEP